MYSMMGENSDANPSSYKITTETITLKRSKEKRLYILKDGIRRMTLKQDHNDPERIKRQPYHLCKDEANKYTVRFHGNKATSGSMQEMKNLEYDGLYP